MALNLEVIMIIAHDKNLKTYNCTGIQWYDVLTKLCENVLIPLNSIKKEI
jgi:hypothetical protein